LNAIQIDEVNDPRAEEDAFDNDNHNHNIADPDEDDIDNFMPPGGFGPLHRFSARLDARVFNGAPRPEPGHPGPGGYFTTFVTVSGYVGCTTWLYSLAKFANSCGFAADHVALIRHR
jgi:hypothetical protein